MIGNKTAIAKALQDYSINQEGEKTFENLYSTVNAQGQAAKFALQEQFAEDVAQAYSTAELSKQNLLASNLLTGAKESELEYFANELEKAYEQHKYNFDTNMSTIDETINKNVGQIQSLVDTEAENYYKLEQSFYPYLQALYKEQTEKGSDLFNTLGWTRYVEDVDGEKQLKSWSDISKDFYTTNNGVSELSAIGVDFYDQMLNAMANSKEGISFDKWLRTYDKDGELYDWVTSANPYAYVKDMGDLNRRIGMFKDLYGMDSKDETWSKTDNSLAYGDYFDTLYKELDSLENESDSLSKYASLLSEYEHLKSGMSEEDVKKFDESLYKGTQLNNDNYHVQGLGSGRKNDDIDITVGVGENYHKEEFDLLVGDAVEEGSVPTLNKLATGDSNTTPKEKKIIVVRNKMYIYTKQGWKHVTADNKKGVLDEAINAFVNKQDLRIER